MRAFVALGAWVLIGAAGAAEPAGSAAVAAAATSTVAARSTVITAVAGIVSYTRWPAEAAEIRLCTVGQSPGVAELQRSAELGSAQRPVTVQALADASHARHGCHAVYIGLVGGVATRELLKLLAGQPVLVLGEGAEFCSDGGMFCLEHAPNAVKFNANLDAIARSGLRVNPLVLRIARGSTASGS